MYKQQDCIVALGESVDLIDVHSWQRVQQFGARCTATLAEWQQTGFQFDICCLQSRSTTTMKTDEGQI